MSTAVPTPVWTPNSVGQLYAQEALRLITQGEAVLRTVAEADTTGDARAEAIWGLMTLIGLALQELEQVEPPFPQSTIESARCYLTQAIGVLSFLEREPLLAAVGTLLDAGDESLGGALAPERRA